MRDTESATRRLVNEISPANAGITSLGLPCRNNWRLFPERLALIRFVIIGIPRYPGLNDEGVRRF